jgi:hypothetical protein
MNDDKGISPIDAARALTPWWMMWIKDFERVEVQPRKIIRYSHGSIYSMPCDKSEASMFVVCGVYRLHGQSGGYEVLQNFRTEKEAQDFHGTLEKTWPHLTKKRPETSSAATTITPNP